MRSSRFSLYCLEDGDEYFGDAIAQYYAPLPGVHSSVEKDGPCIDKRRALPGRLRLSGRALYFEPDEASFPIYVFKFQEIIKKHDWDLPTFTPTQTQALAQPKRRSMGTSSGSLYFYLCCRTVFTQLHYGVIAPWGIQTTPEGDHVFCITYAKATQLFENLGKLLSGERVAGGSRSLEKRNFIEQMMQTREHEVPFSLTCLHSSDEKVLQEAMCSKISPLTAERGRLVVTSGYLYFQPMFPLIPGVEGISLRDVRRVERRWSRFKDVGLEIALFDDRVFLFAFQSRPQREIIFGALGSHSLLDRLIVNDLTAMMRKWVDGRVSTLDYLMYLNWLAGRSLNDLAQYPVLPWVVADYTSSSLDLSNPSTFRDLSKPVGALTPQRLQQYVERAKQLRQIGEETYLYGTHYSNPAYVTYFLVRTNPEYMLVLQNGKLDHGSRIFDSIPDCWCSVCTGPADVKELIPQFYYGDGAFLVGSTSLPLGTKGDGSRVRREVQLPAWASSPKHFMELHRRALEGEYTSQNINNWIDLIFGFKQNGPEAWKAHNVFHPYSYETCVNALSSITDETKRVAIEAHIREFGQTPKQLFTYPHPVRNVPFTDPKIISMSSFMPPDSEELGQEVKSPREALMESQKQHQWGDAKEDVERVEKEEEQEEDEAKEEMPPQTAMEPRKTPPVSPPSRPAVPSTLYGVSQYDDDDAAMDTGLHQALDITHLIHNAQQRAVAESNDSDSVSAKTGSEDPPGVQRVELSSTSEHSSHARGTLDLHLVTTIKATSRHIDALCVCDVIASASWILNDHGLQTIPMVVLSESGGAMSVIDLVQQKKLRTLPQSFGATTIPCLCPCREAPIIYVASQSGEVFVLDMKICDASSSMEVSLTAVTAIAAHLPSQTVATGCKDGVVRLWRTKPDGSLPTMSHFDVDAESRISFIDINLDGKKCAAVTTAGTVNVVTLADNETATFELPEGARGVLFGAFFRNNLLCIGARRGIFNLDVDTGNVWSSFTLPFDIAVATMGRGGFFSPDYCILVGTIGRVSVINCTNGNEVGSFQMHLGNDVIPTCVAANAESIIIGDSSGQVTVLSVDS